MKKNTAGEFVGNRTDEQLKRDTCFKDLAIGLIHDSGENWAKHSLAVLKRNALARIIYLNEVYQKIIPVPGVICEFGVQWGATLATLSNLRALYEPYNNSRIVYGFDTFEGFNDPHTHDGSIPSKGDYSTTAKYEEKLAEILSYHESICPFPEIKKFELIKGDARDTIDVWLKENPHAVISLAIFDMDLYEPTRVVLEKIKELLGKYGLSDTVFKVIVLLWKWSEGLCLKIGNRFLLRHRGDIFGT